MSLFNILFSFFPWPIMDPSLKNILEWAKVQAHKNTLGVKNRNASGLILKIKECGFSYKPQLIFIV